MIQFLVAALQMMDFSTISWVFTAFFIIVLVIIGIAIARMMSGARSRVQRPAVQSTSFPPPLPPDTVMVKCEYCNTQQVWRANCIKCGAPLPKPAVAGVS